MPQIKMSDVWLRNLKLTDGKQIEYSDTKTLEADHGGYLVLLIGAKQKTWAVRYRLNGKRKRFALGIYPQVKLKDARLQAIRQLNNIEDGADPAKEKKQQLEAPTMADLWNTYYERHALKNKKQSSYSNDLWQWHKYIEPVIGSMKAKDIRRKHIIDLHDKLSDSAPVQANRVVALLSTMFNIGIDRELVEVNPCFRIKKTKEISRERVIEDTELVLLWGEWDKVRMGKLFMIKLLTAQRDIEVRSMKWTDIVDGVWTIHDTKNNKTHEVPLSAQVQEILATIPRRGEYVYHAARGNSGHIMSTKKCFRECRERAGIDSDTRGHDLRRTAASNMAESGISEEIIGRVLNHSEHGVTSIYNRHTYLPEKSTALQKWADKLDRILGRKEAKVVELRKMAV